MESLRTVDEIAVKVRQYLGVTALTSVITGAALALWAFTVGLELALVWGLLNFLLNFVPIIGNIIGIVPPTLYAVIQFQDHAMPLVVFVGFAVLQIAIGNVVYPMLQGRSLALSPLAIVVALTFWGWVLGIAGALMAIPLTAAIVIICQHFPGIEWVARLLSSPIFDNCESATTRRVVRANGRAGAASVVSIERNDNRWPSLKDTRQGPSSKDPGKWNSAMKLLPSSLREKCKERLSTTPLATRLVKFMM